jgi:hypothetical protein
MLILLFIATACAQLCTSQAGLIAESYTACLELPKCMDAFFLTPRHRGIEQIAFNDLIVRVIDNAAPLTYVEICANNESFAVWCYGTLQLQHFCRDNEVWDIRYKSCICRHDKICQDEASGTINYSNTITAAVLAIVVIAIIMVCSQLLKETKGINKSLQTPRNTVPLSHAARQ